MLKNPPRHKESMNCELCNSKFKKNNYKSVFPRNRLLNIFFLKRFNHSQTAKEDTAKIPEQSPY